MKNNYPSSKKSKLSLLSATVSVLMVHTAFADDSDIPTATLEDITIIAELEKATTAMETTVNSQDIQDEQVNTQQDLVRYSPDVSVAEVGRYGSKGFAIRGVDGNRVAMSYDGVTLPDQQVNQFFSPYGYMYEGRFSPDTEMLSSVRIKAGSDSFSSGSGAMGGAVNYKSKQPDDLLTGNNSIGGYAKLGYTNKNEEFMQAVGLAGEFNKFSGVVNYAHRNGHELKNHSMIGFDEDKLDPHYDFGHDTDYKFADPDFPNDKASILPDPMDYDSHATMAKIYYQPTDEHRVGLATSYQHRMSHSHPWTKKTSRGIKRVAYDESELTSFGVNYSYYPMDSEWIDTIDADLTRQEVIGIANTFVYDDDSVPWLNSYRPQYVNTDQLTLKGTLLPIETEKFGTHTLSAMTSFANPDYDLIMQETSKFNTKDKPYGFEFVGPAVKKDVYSLALTDDIEINDKLSTQVGLRYDYHNFNPYLTEIGKYKADTFNSYYFITDLYKSGELTKSQSMDNVGWLVGTNYKVNPNWQVGYKASTGFMAPSNMQMYSTFEILKQRLVPNPNLKPEKSINHELSVQGDFKNFGFNATGFYTDYTDFINNTYSVDTPPPSCYEYNGKEQCVSIPVNTYGADNIDKAETYGVRFGGLWDVSNFTKTKGTTKLSAGMSYAKDSTSTGINLLATQPPNAVIGANYYSDDDSYQLHGKMRYLGAKKAKDAKIDDGRFNDDDQWMTEAAPYKHIDKSNSAFVLDFYGSKKFDTGVKVSAGVYNILDKKYVPWANLRSLAETNINSMVDKDGVGVERFTAPGRNFALSVGYEY